MELRHREELHERKMLLKAVIEWFCSYTTGGDTDQIENLRDKLTGSINLYVFDKLYIEEIEKIFDDYINEIKEDN